MVLDLKGDREHARIQLLAVVIKNDGISLRRIVSLAPKDQGDHLRAGLVESMGKAPAGQANAGQWSPDTFATNWNKMSDHAKAIYSDETRRALDDLATISQSAKQSGAFTNRSRTASASHAIDLIRKAAKILQVGANVATHVNPATMAGEAGISFAIGKGLTSPKVARLLVNYQKNGGARILLSRLRVLSSRLTAQNGKGFVDALISATEDDGKADQSDRPIDTAPRTTEAVTPEAPQAPLYPDEVVPQYRDEDQNPNDENGEARP